MLLIGRIVADNDEKATENSLLLESSRSMGGGARVPLDLSQCKSFSLFPGQIACLEGKNPDGTKFIVSEQKAAEDCLVPTVPVSEDKFGSKPVSILVASGPYSMDNRNLDFAPFDKLLVEALSRKPQILLLVC